VVFPDLVVIAPESHASGWAGPAFTRVAMFPENDREFAARLKKRVTLSIAKGDRTDRILEPLLMAANIDGDPKFAPADAVELPAVELREIEALTAIQIVLFESGRQWEYQGARRFHLRKLPERLTVFTNSVAVLKKATGETVERVKSDLPELRFERVKSQFEIEGPAESVVLALRRIDALVNPLPGKRRTRPAKPDEPTVTIRLRNGTLKEFLDEISTQAGMTFEFDQDSMDTVDRSPNDRLDLTIDRMPIGEALDVTLERLNLQAVRERGRYVIRAKPPKPDNPAKPNR
jgi:hypothetical protein